ncbi:uncharacterized protein [Typha latifolia]|uniref:uncharacterized protein n=1 Tax=Typha latifolia TaxID=4733 RepID=UPI003C2E0E4A
MEAWKSALPLLLVAALIAMEELSSTPWCEISGESLDGGFGGDASHLDDLKVMMVADLLLMGSDATYVDLFFRDPFISKYFSKSFRTLKPDLLIVLGDISSKGSELTESKWLTVLQQFQKMLGSSAGIPLHIVLGDRDVGECSKLNKKFIKKIARHLPGLDSAGCSTFDVGNVSFVSLNAVAMLCGNNNLRLSVEKVLERENVYLQRQVTVKTEEEISYSEKRDTVGNFKWKDNEMASGSGPVVLLHFPLHRSIRSNSEGAKVSEQDPSLDSLGGPRSEYSGVIGMASYDIEQTLPANATEYIFQALKPRIVFSAHAHRFYDHSQIDGMREVNVPAMTWATRGKPGFVLVTFGRNGTLSVSHCSLAKEWHVIIGYVFLFFLSMTTLLVIRWSKLFR